MLRKYPWYLRHRVLLCFCFITPPIGYLIVVLNLKKLNYKKRMEYLTLSTFTMSIWILKFLPDTINNLVWAAITAVIVGKLLIKWWGKLKSKYLKG